MSHFGIDLFSQEVPPPGYHTNAENRQISKNMTTQAYLTKAEMMEQSMVTYTAPEAPKTTFPKITCNTTFRIFCPKDTAKPGWTQINSLKSFEIILENPESIGFELFQDYVAIKCGEVFENGGKLMRSAILTGSPHIDWNLYIISPPHPDFKKGAHYHVNDEEHYIRWISAVTKQGKTNPATNLSIQMQNPEALIKQKKEAGLVRNHILLEEAAQKALTSKLNVPGGDLPIPAHHAQPGEFSRHAVLTEEIFSRYPPKLAYKKKIPVYVNPHDANQYILLTGCAVQKWAHALKTQTKGVLLGSTPPELKYVKRSSKKQNLKHVQDLPSQSGSSESDGSVIQPNADLVCEYVRFVKIDPSKQEDVIKILASNDVSHPKFFKSDNITQDDTLKWGLSPGIVAQLRDNVTKFEHHLSSK
ncbi:hypothetical protein PCANC_17117 [Puccinia coronata f. sp. avenae]|uniref:Uncharacterized protein n=1 Tax=Puccinia coronata f. sp. avenae TaxID=200324 RepID=A0A2N5U597_9BASI|nr:hypothetical protein PCANC_17117 [Puccinia coronata f. sp. avenae]